MPSQDRERKRPRFLPADFGSRLKLELQRRGWGAAEFAKRLTPAVTRQTVHQWLNGKDEPETFRWANINATLAVDLCPAPLESSLPYGSGGPEIGGVGMHNQALLAELLVRLGRMEERLARFERLLGEEDATRHRPPKAGTKY